MCDNKLKWQCRRGMRELDVLLIGWFNSHYEAVDDAERSAFRRLLSLPDPELASYLLAGEIAIDPGIARVVDSIRASPAH
ncbi:MAG: succinate dehydrogenase assembly factor 2 [Woeseiaceae bacterium]|nr:succinate dehydrogenase assembly factor 2 [Woeseiaceae bacterium]